MSAFVVDVHTHVVKPEHFGEKLTEAYTSYWGNWPWWRDPSRTHEREDWQTDVQLFVEDMERWGIAKAVIFGVCSEAYGSYTPPEFIAEVVQKHPDKFIGWHAVDPLRGRAALEEVQRAYELGLRGVKTLPPYCLYAINDPRAFPLYAKCQELEIPIVVHTGWSVPAIPEMRLEWQHPLLLEDVGRNFPDLTIIIAHMGSQWSLDAVTMMSRFPRMYGDFASWHNFPPFDHLVRTLVWAKVWNMIGRLLFGSDYPWVDAGAMIEVFRRVPDYCLQYGLEPAVTQDDIDQILGLNAARLLGLEVPLSASA